MRVIRAFVAVLLAEELRAKIAGVLEQARKLAPGVKWVAPENLHVTLKFLGDIPEDELDPLRTGIQAAVGGLAPFEMSVSGLGAFPNAARARVVWVGIQAGGEELARLARAVETELVGLGFPREDKPFRTHVTIGRARSGRPPSGLAEVVENVKADELGAQRVASVALVQSDLRPAGPVYTPLSVIELSGT